VKWRQATLHPRAVSPETSPSSALVRMAQIDASGPTGTFVDRRGSVPW
jgi:hypothetical protein